MHARRISSKELIRNFGSISDEALREPVVITKNGRERLVLLSMESYSQLEQRQDANQEEPPRRTEHVFAR